MRKRALITGAGGLIGRHSVEPLRARGFDVVTLCSPDSIPTDTDHVVVDLLDPHAVAEAVARVEATHLLHLAWYNGQRDRWTSPTNLDWTLATIHLVKSFAATGGRRALCAGSCAEYDWSRGTLKEDTPLRPASVYGATKAAAGLALCAAAPSLGLSLAWARIFFCYGPAEPQGRLLGDLVRGLNTGQPVDCTDGTQKRDFLHTVDVAEALAGLLDTDVDGAINVGSGHAISVKDIVIEVANQMGKPDLVNLGALKRPHGDPPIIEADVSRLHGATGFKPRFDLKSGVADILKSEGLA